MNPPGGEPAKTATRGKRRISMTGWIVIATILGALIGGLFPQEAKSLKVVSDIFLNLIKCIIVPLLFSTLVVGIAAHSDDLKAVGRLAFKSLVYFEVITTLALVVGLLVVNIAKPGVGVVLEESKDKAAELAKPHTWQEILVHVAPSSFFDSAAKNDVLQVVVFAIIFAIALTQVSGKPKET